MIENAGIGSEEWNNGPGETSGEMTGGCCGGFDHNGNCSVEHVDGDGPVRERPLVDTLKYEAEHETGIGCLGKVKEQTWRPDWKYLQQPRRLRYFVDKWTYRERRCLIFAALLESVVVEEVKELALVGVIALCSCQQESRVNR